MQLYILTLNLRLNKYILVRTQYKKKTVKKDLKLTFSQMKLAVSSI